MLTENKNINKALLQMGFESFTEIQAKTIPTIMNGQDVIGHSETGTGKTAAFAIPILDQLDFSSKDIQALILCPTRELAVQVTNEIERMGQFITELRTVCVYGGDSYPRQMKALSRNPQIVVGTPGRTIDHINRKLINLNNIKYLVLDEADEMLKMGFKEDLEIILSGANKSRQTVLFSATMPKFIEDVAQNYMNKPKKVSVVTNTKTNSDITQYGFFVKRGYKTEALLRVIPFYQSSKILIFCNTKRKVNELTMELNAKGMHAEKMHGDLVQKDRSEILNQFHKNKVDILIATDVIGRGLDIKEIDTVINYDVPDKAEHYIHRIGRTGRIGNKGLAMTLIEPNERRMMENIERYTNQNVTIKPIPSQNEMDFIYNNQKLVEINQMISISDFDDVTKLAELLLETNEPEEIILALLKLNDSRLTVSEETDINDTYSAGSGSGDNKRSRRRDRSRRSDGRSEGRSDRGSEGRSDRRSDRRSDSRERSENPNSIRYHLNIGSSSGVTKAKLAEMISLKTRIKNMDIDDISIQHSFSFFSTDVKFKTNVFGNLVNEKMFGKTVSVKEATSKRS